ncbi:MAG: nucleotidyltransferase, partial [Comamonadaceae bacterium CG_4_9_14_0_8_um_filter_57_21]
MKPSATLELQRHAIREATMRYQATNPRVFGSIVHGNDTDGSDLDLLVDPLP